LKEVSEIMNFPKYCILVLAALALGSSQRADAHGGGGSGHGSGGGSHGFASGFHGASGFHSSAGSGARNSAARSVGNAGTPTFGITGTPTFGVTGRSADFPARVAGQNSGNRHSRPTSGWNPNWDRVWHGRHYHWNNGAWAIINDGDYPWDDSYYFPASPDVYPDMSYEYNDTAPAAAPFAPADAAVPTNGAAPTPAAGVTTAAPKPGSIAAAVQRNLAARGYYGGQVDGIVRESTRDAISDFQEDNAMPATGSITQSLLKALGL
jgi:hypothetical protein